MLTIHSAKAALASTVARIGVVIVLSAMTWIPARADTLMFGGCTGALGGSFNCVARWGVPGDPYIRQVPQPTSDAEKARAVERDLKWLNRCQPVVTQDQYGVPRYRYVATGCEFGVGE